MNYKFLAINLLNLVLVNQYYCDDISANNKSTNRYLVHLFRKYGTKGFITFEGLEHLMYNLGLGGLEFNPSHSLNEHRPDGFTFPGIGELIRKSNYTKRQINDEKVIKTKLNLTEISLNRSELVKDMDELANSEFFQEIVFKNIHDPSHLHPKLHEHTQYTNSCMSPMTLVSLIIKESISSLSLSDQPRYKTENHKHGEHMEISTRQRRYSDPMKPTDIRITPKLFLNICPALLTQIDEGACVDRKKNVAMTNKTENIIFDAWIYATISVFIISACGLIGVAIVPLAKTIAYKEIIRFLIGLAVGTLCGDALMHLLPHAVIPHNHHSDQEPLFTNVDSRNDPIWLCCCTFFTIVLMYSLENLLPLLGNVNSHTHRHSNQSTISSTDPQKIESSDADADTCRQPDDKELNTMLKETTPIRSLSPVAVMVLFGDGLHNITDGMAIGAAFAVAPVTGMATAFAVLCHELPHELGDFALLLKTGVTIRRAMSFNVMSSLLSFIGMCAGLVIAERNGSMVRWIYSGTAGSFLYIALADLVPEMGRNMDKTVKGTLVQIIGIVIGGLIMVIIALYEDNLIVLFE